MNKLFLTLIALCFITGCMSTPERDRIVDRVVDCYKEVSLLETMKKDSSFTNEDLILQGFKVVDACDKPD